MDWPTAITEISKIAFPSLFTFLGSFLAIRSQLKTKSIEIESQTSLKAKELIFSAYQKRWEKIFNCTVDLTIAVNVILRVAVGRLGSIALSNIGGGKPLKTHKHELVFCTDDGEKLLYDNLRRDFLNLLKAVGVEKAEGSFHAFRRFFGKQYLRNGGNPLYLQRVFGHSTLEMTRRYVEADDEDLQLAHKTLSPLE
jgi:integrase